VRFPLHTFDFTLTGLIYSTFENYDTMKFTCQQLEKCEKRIEVEIGEERKKEAFQRQRKLGILTEIIKRLTGTFLWRRKSKKKEGTIRKSRVEEAQS
jgi:hypothetical protein